MTTSVAKPVLSSVYFDRLTNALTFTGSHFSGNLDISKLSLRVGAHKYLLTSSDHYDFYSSTSFSIMLANPDAILPYLNGNAQLTIDLANAWDGVGGAAINHQGMNISTLSVVGFTDTGTPQIDTTTLTPFSQIYIQEDNFNNYTNETYTVDITFKAANGRLSDEGMDFLSPGKNDNNGHITYTLSTTDLTSLVIELRGVIFTPTQHQKPVGQTVNTTFDVGIQATGTNQLLWSNFFGPGSLAIDSQDNIYVCNNGAVQEFTSPGKLKNTLSQGLTSPVSIAVDSQDHIFVCDDINNSVSEFSSTGQLIKTINTDLKTLCSIAVDSQGDLYVSDTIGTIEQYSINDAVLNWSYALNSSSLLDFNTLATNSLGNVFVRTNSEVEYFSHSGALLNTYSIGLTHPTGLAVDANNNLYISDSNNTNGVVILSSSGVVSNLPSNNSLGATSVTIDSKGNVYAGYIDGSILEYSSSGILLKTLSAGAVSKYPAYNMAVNSQGNVLANYPGAYVSEIYPSPITLASNTYVTPAISVTSTSAPTITGVSYSASIGQLTLKGTNLLTGLKLSLPAHFTITGQNHQRYTLANDTNTVISNTIPISDTEVVLDLSAANQMAINGLLNRIGNQSVDNTRYALSAKSGWETDAPQINNIAINVSTVPEAPSLSSASYCASNGILTVTGTNLVNLGYGSGILLKNLKLSAGSKSLSLSAEDTNFGIQIGSPDSFSIKLSNAEQKSANALFTCDGNNNGATAYTLTAKNGWDAGLGITNSVAVNVSGNISINGKTNSSGNIIYYTNTDQITNPFAHVRLVDSNVNPLDSASISLSAGGLRSDSSGVLSAGITTQGITTYTLTAIDPASLQSELQKLIYIPGSALPTKSISLKLTITDSYSLSPSQIFSSEVSNPNNLFTDNQGNVYVTNAVSWSNNIPSGSVDNTLLKFSSTGKLLSTIDIDPRGVASNKTGAFLIDTNGNIFVSTWKGNEACIKEYSKTGTLLHTFTGGLTQADQLTLDNLGNIYVANNQNTDAQGNFFSNVKEFSSSGTLLNTFGDGYNVDSYAVDHNGNVYILYSGMSNVDIFNSSGALTGHLSTGLVSPVEVCVDSRNHVYVADSGNTTGAGFVEEFVNGNLINTLSVSITAATTQMLIDKMDNLYVVSTSINGNGDMASVVNEFSASGTLVRTLPINSAAIRMAADNQGNLYITDPLSITARIEKFSPAITATVNASESNSLVQVASGTDHTNYVVKPNALNNLNIILAPHSGDSIKINDATKFLATEISTSNVLAAGGDVNSLAGWVAGALSSHAGAGNLVSHGIAWFQFDNNTYLIEQAGKQGSAYTNTDTLIQMVGIYDESNAVLHSHELSLA